MNRDKPAGDTYPGTGLSIKHLICALKTEVAQVMIIMSVDCFDSSTVALSPFVYHQSPQATGYDPPRSIRRLGSFSHWLIITQVLEWGEEATSVVVDMQQLLNTFNTAAQLPSDILVIIPSSLPEDLDVLTLSHVCRRWRTIVNSAPLLWGRMDCRDLNRTIIGLERIQSTPLRLKLNRNFSIAALKAALAHGKITSVFADILPWQVRAYLRRLAGPSVKEFVISISEDETQAQDTTPVILEGGFMSMRKLFVSGCPLSINRITASNLIHLSLEFMDMSMTTALPVLDLLRGCSLLETALIYIAPAGSSQHALQPPTPVTLPKLHALELGDFMVCSGLIIHLRFPPGVTVGFRDIKLDGTTWPCEPTQHVLVATSIESVTISHIRHSAYTMYDSYLLRFEGPEGSLEVSNSESGYRSSCDPGELLLSPSLRLENVKTLRIMDCFDRHILEKLGSVMPNLISIQFIGRNLPMSVLSQTPMGGSPVQFPYLKHIVGLSAGPSLVNLARSRKRMGVPLSSLDVNDGADDWSRTGDCLKEDMPGYAAELKEIVEDVKVWKCGYLPERWTNNAILDVWEEPGRPGPVSAEVIGMRARWTNRFLRCRLNGSMLTTERSTVLIQTVDTDTKLRQ